MSYIHSDPTRISDPHAIEDVEVFYLGSGATEDDDMVPGWYWWTCFPGCLPDSDPVGPFETEQEAIDDARSTND